MKMQVLGVKVLKGIKDGNPWDMSAALIQTKIESFQNEKVTAAGYGYPSSQGVSPSTIPPMVRQFLNATSPRALTEASILVAH